MLQADIDVYPQLVGKDVDDEAVPLPAALSEAMGMIDGGSSYHRTHPHRGQQGAAIIGSAAAAALMGMWKADFECYTQLLVAIATYSTCLSLRVLVEESSCLKLSPTLSELCVENL